MPVCFRLRYAEYRQKYCNQVLHSDVQQYNNFSAIRWFASITTTERPESDYVLLNQIYINSNIQNWNLCHRQGRLQQTNVMMGVSGRTHSKLHSSVMQIIMTQILMLTVTQLSRHCRIPSGKDGSNRWVVCSTSGWVGILSWPIACIILEGLHMRTIYKAC
jgi:hypothetical protein